MLENTIYLVVNMTDFTSRFVASWASNVKDANAKKEQNTFRRSPTSSMKIPI